MCWDVSVINLKYPGISEVKAELGMDFDSTTIKQLCVQKEGDVNIVCFPSAAALLCFCKEFWIMTIVNKSSLFIDVWSMTLSEVKKNANIENVFSLIWEPTFKECESILDQLYNQTIELAVVDRYFQHYRVKENIVLESDLTALFNGINACHGKKPSSDWLHPAVHRIRIYWKLGCHQKPAQSLMNLLETLKLSEEDFKDVEMFTKEVNHQ